MKFITISQLQFKSSRSFMPQNSPLKVSIKTSLKFCGHSGSMHSRTILCKCLSNPIILTRFQHPYTYISKRGVHTGHVHKLLNIVSKTIIKPNSNISISLIAFYNSIFIPIPVSILNTLEKKKRFNVV